jgi:hypothetical protein
MTGERMSRQMLKPLLSSAGLLPPPLADGKPEPLDPDISQNPGYVYSPPGFCRLRSRTASRTP